MVRALLAGTKTQTRRAVKGAPDDWTPMQPQVFSPTVIDRHGDEQPGSDAYGAGNEDGDCWIRCPYGQPGERLWVREAWAHWGRDDQCGEAPATTAQPIYRADGDHWDERDRWRPSIHMPRWASRITLEITEVRVERLQDISESDADAEGCERLDSDREDPDWNLCPQCGGTRLYTSFGPNLGACPDTDCTKCDTYVKRYRHLWETINGEGTWDANPWVWAISFKRVT
jgi:hypothetical protein